MVARPVLRVTALAIGSAGYLVVKFRGAPAVCIVTGRALSLEMVIWALMAGRAICCPGNAVVKICWLPSIDAMAGLTRTLVVILRSVQSMTIATGSIIDD